MKIRVTTNRYEYMGLFQNSHHDVEATAINSWNNKEYYFKHMGRKWALTQDDCEELVSLDDFPSQNEKLLDVINTDLKQQGPIKSDGGSSSYYDLPVAEWLLYTLNERQKEGKCYIKTEEMISAFFGNDFSFGTLLKSLVRAWGIKVGAGKAGNDMKYETGKIRYYADKILEQNEEKK